MVPPTRETRSAGRVPRRLPLLLALAVTAAAAVVPAPGQSVSARPPTTVPAALPAAPAPSVSPAAMAPAEVPAVRADPSNEPHQPPRPPATPVPVPQAAAPQAALPPPASRPAAVVAAQPSTVPAATARPATAPATAPASALEGGEIRRGAAPVAPGKPAAPAAPTMELPRVAMSLAAVVALIFFLRWGSKKFLTLPAAGGSGLMQVVARSPLAPRQQLLLVRVGQRLLVVGDSGGRLSPLGQITDPDEVAAMVGQAKASASAAASPGAATFGAMFRKVGDRFRGTDRQAADDAAGWDADTTTASHADAGAERGQLLAKFDDDVDETGRDGSVPPTEPTAAESAVESARKDIRVLREKLQQVTRRMGDGEAATEAR